MTTSTHPGPTVPQAAPDGSEATPVRDAVLVAVDGSDRNRAAVAWAAEACRLHGGGLALAHVIDRHTGFDAAGYRRGWSLLQATRDAAAADGCRVAAELASGPVDRALVRLAADQALLVVGRRGHGTFLRLRIGSTSLSVAGLATVPVVVVPDGWHPEEHRALPVVVGVDPADPPRRALGFAFREAALRGVPLVVAAGREPVEDSSSIPAGLVPEPRETKALEDALLQHRSEHPEVEVRVVHRRAHPLEVLLNLAGPTQLIVLGRHSDKVRGGFPFGSIARSTLHYAEVPVAIVPPRA